MVTNITTQTYCRWNDIKRGDIINVDFGKTVGSIQGGVRPALVVQNDIGNAHSPTTQVVPITSQAKKPIPTHFTLLPDTGLREKSTALCEQTVTIDKRMIINRVGKISESMLSALNKCLMASFGICL